MTNSRYENHLHDTEPRWFAVYTRFQREKIIKKRLSEKGIEAYVPLIKVTQQYKSKRRVSLLPLISGYVFTRIISREYVPVLETQDVVHFVRFAKNLIAVPEREIAVLQRVVGGDIELEVEKSVLHVGERVEIASGKLAGLQGKLLQCSGKNFLIELDHIGYSLRMHVPNAWLRKAEVKYG